MPINPRFHRVITGCGAALSLLAWGSGPVAAATPSCSSTASPDCYQQFKPAGAKGVVHYYASLPVAGPQGAAAPTRALIAVHGHPRDANKTFEAALLATRRAGRTGDTLVIAPVFQVADADAGKCHTAGVPGARAGDLLWTCESWLDGGVASNEGATGSFNVLDALVATLKRQWPSLKTITIAGFSAGGQMVQHYIGFAADPTGLSVRYVVADPGTWLYFDPLRPQPVSSGQPADGSSCTSADNGACRFKMTMPPQDCPQVNQWKYGMENLPGHFTRNASQARRHYAEAEIHYLEGALDSSAAKGTFYPILDKSCAAAAQGPYRMQRGLAYAAYDRALLAPDKKRTVTLVPGCAHNVACVFPSEAARQALFGDQ
ncbi:hypothetical protein [Sodalis sp. dw_96]|uniref:hypothetical protein n=1 Tax=Sodalis sp. dw_96 TaxID=2719794 RepID=UPI001BD1EB33|nr:hypothetical protein [Sodalis sp. dw_96]